MDKFYQQGFSDILLMLDLAPEMGKNLCRAVGERWMLTAEEIFVSRHNRRAQVEDLPQVLQLIPLCQNSFRWVGRKELAGDNCPCYPYTLRTGLFCTFLLGAVDIFSRQRGLKGPSLYRVKNKCLVMLDREQTHPLVNAIGLVDRETWKDQFIRVLGDQFCGGLAVVDSHRQCVYVNQRGRELFGDLEGNVPPGKILESRDDHPVVTTEHYQLDGGYQMLIARENGWARLENFSVLAELAASMAHEVRNPLTVVDGYLQVLAENHPELIEYYQLMSRELARANAILTEYLHLARADDTEYCQFPVNQLLQEIYLLLEAQAVKEGKTIKFKPGNNVPAIYGDASRLKQVFLNLGNNGLQACNQKGSLTLYSSYDPKQENVIIGFIDNGPGVAPELQEKIFSPFFSTKKGGTGLGLAVSRRIVSAHGGKITVDNEPGGGAHFRVYLPLEIHSSEG